MKSIIRVHNISKSFEKCLFKDVNIEIQQGTIVGIIGENGSGKSILFKIMCGLETPDSGQIFFKEKRLEKNEVPKGIGYLINSPGYIELYSGFQNLKYLANILGKISDEDIRKTMEFVGLDSRDTKKTKYYSMGMKQKLGIAQAVMENQEVIFLDEPFNGLDYETKKDIFELIKKLKKSGKTILLTSHLLEDLLLCDKYYILSNQTIKECSDNDVKNRYQIV